MSAALLAIFRRSGVGTWFTEHFVDAIRVLLEAGADAPAPNSYSASSQIWRSAGTMRAFHLGSGDGEEEAAGGSCVVKRGCENLKGSGEGAALGASGGEEAA
jgi:hypothetical protein